MQVVCTMLSPLDATPTITPAKERWHDPASILVFRVYVSSGLSLVHERGSTRTKIGIALGKHCFTGKKELALHIHSGKWQRYRKYRLNTVGSDLRRAWEGLHPLLEWEPLPPFRTIEIWGQLWW